MMIKKKYLLVSASIAGLSAMMLPQSVMAQTCSGTQTRTTQCVDNNGNAVNASFCVDNGLAQPTTSQNCNYSCPPPPSSGDGDGDGDGCGSCADTDGDGLGDMSVGQAQAGGHDYNSVDNMSDNDSGANASDAGDGDGGDGDGDGDSVLCTYFHRHGEISDEDYYAGFIHGMKHSSEQTWRGYHAWAVPYVRYMYNNPGTPLENLIRPVVMHRMAEISYQMGVRDKPDYIGKAIRLVLDNISYALGFVAKETDYASLYSREEMKMFAQHYKAYKNRDITSHAQRDPTAIVI